MVLLKAKSFAKIMAPVLQLNIERPVSLASNGTSFLRTRHRLGGVPSVLDNSGSVAFKLNILCVDVIIV